MEAFLGFPDGKYHIPPFGLRQVATIIPRPVPGGGAVQNPKNAGFFLYREMEYNPGCRLQR
jgi:hypothetical protein